MDLQKFNQSLEVSQGQKLIKVPEAVYEIWYDIALGLAQQNATIAYRQKRLFEEITKWVEQKYPGYGMVNFADFSSKEAALMSLKIGKPVTWGMYILLEPGVSMEPYSPLVKLLRV